MADYIATCLCGASEIEISGRPLNIANCHCQMCRNHSGGPFASYVVVKDDQLRVARDSMAGFSINTGEKYFCSYCGTPMYNIYGRTPGLRMVYLGVVRGHERLVPRINIWCDSKLPWIDDVSAIKSFPGNPPIDKRPE